MDGKPRICENCKTVMPPDHAFCPACGARTGSAPSVASRVVRAVVLVAVAFVVVAMLGVGACFLAVSVMNAPGMFEGRYATGNVMGVLIFGAIGILLLYFAVYVWKNTKR